MSPAAPETVIVAAIAQFGIIHDELVAPTRGNQPAFAARNVTAFLIRYLVRPQPSFACLAEVLGFAQVGNAMRAEEVGKRLLLEDEKYADAAIAISMRIDAAVRTAAGVVKAVYREDLPQVEIRRTA